MRMFAQVVHKQTAVYGRCFSQYLFWAESNHLPFEKSQGAFAPYSHPTSQQTVPVIDEKIPVETRRSFLRALFLS